MNLLGKPVTIERVVALRHLALLALSQEDLNFGRAPLEVSLSDMVVHRGALFDSSGQRVLFPQGSFHDRCYVALLDPNPRARWSHRAFWGFVSATREGPIILHSTDFPENCTGPTRLLPVPAERWKAALKDARAMRNSRFLESYHNLQIAMWQLEHDGDPRSEDLCNVLDHLSYRLTDQERADIDAEARDEEEPEEGRTKRART